MKLNRQAIQRMIDAGSINVGGRKTGGGGGGIGGGGVNQQWVEDNYISKAFFNSLFTIHAIDENDADVVVEPNDTDTTPDSIQANFGLWTNQYLTALGQGSGGSGGGGASALYDLVDVVPNDNVNPSMVFGLTGDRNADDGKVLTFSKDEGGWIAAPPTGGGSVTSITLQTPIGMLVNGYSSETITGDGSFNLTFAEGFSLASSQDLEFIERIIWGTWWGCDLDEYGHVAGAMSMVPSIDNLLFFNMDSQNNYSDIELRTRFGSKFLFTNDSFGLSMLNVRNTGETDDTIVFEVESSELVINENPVDGSQKSLALKAYSWIDFYTADTWRMIIDSSGNVGIGNASPYALLDVAGGVKADKFYLYKPNAANDVGAIYFQVEYNSNNVATGVHLYNGGLSADTYITALGTGGSSGGGGGATSLTQLSDVNPSMNPRNGDILTFNGSVWTSMSPQSGGSVTQINVGIGLKTADGQPITNTGTISLNDTYKDYAEHGETIYQARDNYLLKADVKTLQFMGGSTNVLTYDPKGANKTITITTDSTLAVDTATANTIKLKMVQFANLAGTYTKVTVDTYGRVTSGTTPTTVQGYGITDAATGLVVGSGSNANKIGVSTRGGNTGWITVPFATDSTYATQLKTTSKIWGRSFNGTADVSGLIENASGLWINKPSGGGYIYFNYNSSNSVTSDITEYQSGTLRFNSQLFVKNGGNVGIGGNPDNSIKLKVTGSLSVTTTAAISGTATVGNLSSQGYVTALTAASSSDARMKNVIEDFVLTADEIAEAPIVKFTWKAGEDKSVHVGSIAQYWYRVLPESVLEVDGMLSLEYGVLALLSVISLARTVVNHEQRLQRLEKELFN